MCTYIYLRTRQGVRGLERSDLRDGDSRGEREREKRWKRLQEGSKWKGERGYRRVGRGSSNESARLSRGKRSKVGLMVYVANAEERG